MPDAVAIHHRFPSSPLTNFYSFDTKSKNKIPCIILVQYGMSHDDDLHISSSKIISSAKSFLNIYMYDFRWLHKKTSDREYSTHCRHIMMMHFIVSKANYFLKNTVYTMKIYNPHSIGGHT